MKYLKTFEGRNSTSLKRAVNPIYLSVDDTINLTNFIRDYINDLNIFDKIDDLTLSDLEDSRLEYRTIFNTLIGVNLRYNDKNSFYYNLDEYNRKNKFNFKSTAFRNSIFKIEDLIYKEYKSEFKNKLDSKIIELFSYNPDFYREYYKESPDNINSVVKNACSWIIQADKYNI